ncbi:M56 family metallopeptidase [Paenimyroides aestuarii]|uniref:Peptidase M56 domain-containing protein n=1 Tax=Paenimyroides aestuarii TaxID=2968490 RepID=A0ABY5NVN4_9FLAO|nr:M56 family metallopeptidase [Paenimyroides aestuarii]UUV22673.1 hypothetical protein NPX36_06425 [Paenimyroides aestuarii]
MIEFFIKSTTALASFYIFYILFLKKEKAFYFNRWYLILSIVLAFFYGSYTYTYKTVISAESLIEQPILNGFTPQKIILNNQIAENGINYLPYFLGFIYLSGFIFFAFRFVRNLLYFSRLKSKNSTSNYKNVSVVLVENLNTSFSFLNTIYVDKSQFENNEVEEELLLHEYHHIKQKHSIDILFVETLTCFMWFNPLLYLYKKAIQLNHEFLADEATLNSISNKTKYQYLLLQKESLFKNSYLASNFNFLLIKNRLIMMNKTKSKIKSTFFVAGAIVLSAFLFYSFCVKEEVAFQEPKVNETNTTKQYNVSQFNNVGKNLNPFQVKKDVNRSFTSVDTKVSDAEYFKDVEITVYETKRSLDDGFRAVENINDVILFSKKYQDFTKEELQQYDFLFKQQEGFDKMKISKKELEQYKNKNKYAIWIDDVNVSNEKLNNYKPEDFAYYSGSSVYKNARTKKHPQPFQYSFYTHDYFEKKNMGKWLSRHPGKSIVVWVSTKK